MQKLRDERHADEETSKQSKGKKKKDKDHDKSKQSKHSQPKEAGTAAVAKAWRQNQLTADKGVKRCAIHPSPAAYCDCTGKDSCQGAKAKRISSL